MSAAVDRLCATQERTGSLLSIGLEPAADRLPDGFADSIEGHEAFLHLVIEGTRGLACAYKLNLAFFEALGGEGAALMQRVAEAARGEAIVIADGKRGDIGSSSAKYADAIYGWLGAESATVNPLMGTDSVRAFLDWEDRLTFVLGLTSNPGAADFLGVDDLGLRIAKKANDEWNAKGNCGIVVGATRGDSIRSMREAAPGCVFLMPGVGAQGGDLERSIAAGRADGTMGWSGIVIHSTRGVLPGKGEGGDVVGVIREKATALRDRCARAMEAAHAG